MLLRILAIHHAQITVPKGEENEARRFYCGVLGLEEIPKPASLGTRGGLWLGVGDRQLHIGVEDGVDRPATKAHIAYEVDDVAAWRKLLGEHGLNILDSIPIPGYDRFEFRDPFGNRVELIQPIRSQARE
jgi:catechol 2,3-dioxygenase-like lactoylglutathione lyase family enzyme